MNARKPQIYQIGVIPHRLVRGDVSRFIKAARCCLNKQRLKVRTPFVISLRGMTLEQLGQLLESHPVKVEVHYASNMTLDKFRFMAVKNLQESDNFVIVNYLRKSIDQQRWGHISPIAAYNHQTDRFLILDVSRDKYPPVWVKAPLLWQAMATRDSEAGKTRGLVLVSSR